MDATVAICTRNRRRSLVETLETLRHQSAKARWELLIVDNGSDDATSDAVREIAGSLPVEVRVETEAEIGLSFARNRALEVARGELVLFLDDDVNARAGLVDAHVEAFRYPEVVGTGGRILPLLPPDTPAWFRDLVAVEIGGPTSRYDFGDEVLAVGPTTKRSPPIGANMAVGRRTARDAGGFRADLGWGRHGIPGEESEFFRRIARERGRLLYVPSAIVEHRIAPERTRREYLVRWYRAHGRSTIRSKPRTPPCRRVAGAIKEARRASTWRWRHAFTRATSGTAYGHSLQRAAKAEGRLLELLGW